jgi:hypothetical protein
MDYYILCVLLVIIVIVVGVHFYWIADDEEGFANEEYSFVKKFFPVRGDVGEYEEESGFTRDPRYFAGYADVQSLGANLDFCRMVVPDGTSDPKESFFACALAGTENLSGTSYRTETVGEGLKRSRDDYMSEPVQGRQNYCRIIKTADGNFQPMCRRALDRRFGKKDIIDAKPIKRIATLLDFYENVVTWLRLRDDMVDYAQNLIVMKGGNISIDETPNPPTTEGLSFNGIDQFLRLGENQSLEFGTNINLRGLRAVSLWVRFDEFTNNAHIFDFGNGAGKDNVFLGIVGRGNATVNTDTIRRLLCADQNTVPEPPSGQQPVFTSPWDEVSAGCVQAAGGGCTGKYTDGAPLMRPQTLMATTAANVDEFTCPGFEVEGRRMKPLQPRALPKGGPAKTADLIYEVWDRTQRKMQIKVSNAVTLGEWTHIVITATNDDAFRPDIAIYVNGTMAATKPSGFLPQTNYVTHNYIGKSNWSSVTSQYENKDELFKGSLFDFRMYAAPLSFEKIIKTINWGTELLGIAKPRALPADVLARAGPGVVPLNELPNYQPLDAPTTLGTTESPFPG